VNQKKCPKCGEMNPAEAVMCWACYTPLTGGAVGAGGAGAAAVGAPAVIAHDEEEGKKKAIPAWQMGAVGLGLLVLLGVGAKTMMVGSTDDTAVDTTGAIVSDPGRVRTGPATTGPATGPSLPTNPGGGSTTSAPIAAPYTMVLSPNPNLEWGIAAIVPTQANTGGPRAAGIAGFARRTLKGNWKAMHIYVFDSAQSAQTFNEYQIPRRSDVLQASDYSSLAALWPHCLARYEYNGGKESYSEPARNPTGWWMSGRSS
jgi:hypothetical protein